MVYGDELIFSGAMTRLEKEQWIQNMEDHMKDNSVGRNDMVQYALQYFEKGVATWWRMYQAINGWREEITWEEFKLTLLRSRLVSRTRKPSVNDLKKPCACKICGEIGHTHEEHQDECPHCEESHPAEECPTRQVTCFLCEGTTHYPAQCNLYPMVHKVTQQHKEGMKEALSKQI